MSREIPWTDPYDNMSDEELDEYVDKLFAHRSKTVAVSLRIAPEVLSRVKREAARAGMPYQTFIKRLLEAGTARLERRIARSKPTARRSARR